MPLAQAPTSSVLPNLMYILDDSGSMNYNYMPDHIQTTSGGLTFRNCKLCGAPNTVQSVGSGTNSVSAVSTSQDRITGASNHNGAVGSTVVFTGGTPPAPLAAERRLLHPLHACGQPRSRCRRRRAARTINITGTTTGASFRVDRERIDLVNNHGAAVGGTVVFTSGTPPTPFLLNTVYFIVSVPSADEVVLAATAGGVPIIPTSTTTGATVDVNGGACGAPSGSAAGSGVPCGNDNNDANAPSTTSSPDYGEAPFYANLFNRSGTTRTSPIRPAVDSTGTRHDEQHAHERVVSTSSSAAPPRTSRTTSRR